MARLFIEARTKIMKEEQVDRVEELLKEVVNIVKEHSPMASGVDLDYRIGNVDVSLMMRPVTGTMLSWRARTQMGYDSGR